MRFLISTGFGKNLACNCAVTSLISWLWVIVLRDFMIRTTAASILKKISSISQQHITNAAYLRLLAALFLQFLLQFPFERQLVL